MTGRRDESVVRLRALRRDKSVISEKVKFESKKSAYARVRRGGVTRAIRAETFEADVLRRGSS